MEAIPGRDHRLVMMVGSAVITRDSKYVAGPVFDEPRIIHADIGPERINECYLLLGADGHYSPLEVFYLEVKNQPQSDVTFKPQGE